MKLALTHDEVKDIVIATINERLGTKFNRCEIERYSYATDYAVLSVEEPKAEEN